MLMPCTHMTMGFCLWFVVSFFCERTRPISEMACYTGDWCHEREIQKYYAHLTPGAIPSPSPYCNSAVMGSSTALADVIPRLIRNYTTFRQGKKFNDQEAMTYRVHSRLWPSAPWLHAYHG